MRRAAIPLILSIVLALGSGGCAFCRTRIEGTHTACYYQYRFYPSFLYAWGLWNWFDESGLRSLVLFPFWLVDGSIAAIADTLLIPYDAFRTIGEDPLGPEKAPPVIPKEPDHPPAAGDG